MWVAAVTEKKCELNVLVAGPVKKRLVDHPVIGVEGRHVSNSVGVLPLCCIERQKTAQRLSVLIASVLPVGLQRLPEVVVQSLDVGVAVLHDQGLHSLGMLD